MPFASSATRFQSHNVDIIPPMPEPLEYQGPQTAPAVDYRTIDLAWSSIVSCVLGSMVAIFAVITISPTIWVKIGIVFAPSAVGIACAITAICRILRNDPRRRGLAVAIVGIVISCLWAALVVYAMR